MSCCNASQYVSDAVESILEQTYSDYELLLINDGSTDNTLDVAKEYASQDKRIVVVDKSNTGLADSLNKGLGLARGEWIARLDADDIALPDRLAKQMSFIQRHETVVLLGTGCIIIDRSGSEGAHYRYPVDHDSLVRRLVTYGSPFPHSSVVFHRETVMGIGGYNRRFVRSQDYDLWLRLSEIKTIACLPEALVKIRKHPCGISNHNAGSTALTMGMAAGVCHFLRAKGASDPSQEEDDRAWEDFLCWLVERMEQEPAFESYLQWLNMRRDFSASIESGGRFGAALRLAGGLLTSGHPYRILLNRLRRPEFHPQLADEWLRTRAN
jgi:glycosyltransferase involved in cell wall biosynthesis